MLKDVTRDLVILISITFVLSVGSLMLSVKLFQQEAEIAKLRSQKELLIKQIEFYKEQLEEATEPDYVGLASWYGEADDECLDCRSDRIMANGELFDETALTVATRLIVQEDRAVVPEIPLGTILRIVNIDSNRSVNVEVTDTGGFNNYGKILDLSKGVKNFLECSDVCNVEIYVERES